MSQRVAVIVNSCLKYLPVTVPPLLRTLRDAGTPMAHVHVVVGETPPEECGDALFEDVHVHHVPYGNVDNNALIWASLASAKALEGYDWVFYLHDTCLVKPAFWERTLAACEEHAAQGHQAARIRSTSSMCIGLYRLSALRAPHMAEWMREMTNLDLSHATIYKHKGGCEDIVFGRMGGWGVLNAVFKYVSNVPNPYGTNVRRNQEEFENPGVVKVKANCTLQTWVMDP